MRKSFLLMLVAAGLLAAPVARADRPTRIPLTAFDYVDSICGYPVSVHFVLNAETLTIFSNGDALVTGPLSEEMSANGKTVSMNISGPGMITTNPDGSVSVRSEGVSGGRLRTADGVILAFFAGPVSVESGLPTLEHGTILLDICTALAP